MMPIDPRECATTYKEVIPQTVYDTLIACAETGERRTMKYYRDAWQVRRLENGYHVIHYSKRLSYHEDERVFKTIDEVLNFLKESEADGYVDDTEA